MTTRDDGAISDRELAGLVVNQGDEAAFRTLYRRHSPAVHQFVLRLLGGNAHEADDVSQETWLRAAKALERFRWESSLRTWISGIALNRVREMARKQGRQMAEVPDGWEAGAPLDDVTGRIDLERALQLLPQGYRTVLVLHDVEGFTHDEIGERLGIAAGTSKSQLHRARRAMRRLLEPALDSPGAPAGAPAHG